LTTEHARELHFSSIVVDTHSDSLARTVDDGDDLGTVTGRGHMDLPRMRAGHQTAQFFAAYVHPDYLEQGTAVQRVLQYTDAMNRLCQDYPNEIELARTAGDIRRIVGAGKLAGILCLEGGHAILDDLAVLREFHRLGVRYMTLTHNNSNNWGDGILDEPRHGGLTDFGRDVIREMNRVGILVDISHVAVKTFWDAMETTTKPVIASHSSSYVICQNPRNINDDQLRAVAENGGVVGVNFEVTFISQSRNVEEDRLNTQRDDELAGASDDAKAEIESKYKGLVGQLARPDWTEIVDHIDHMVGVAGIDHVGLGSDFDGCRLPNGMEDCTQVPKITEELVRRGYSDADVVKILGENTLRVMEAALGE
jgi:membrane dipeptidase